MKLLFVLLERHFTLGEWVIFVLLFAVVGYCVYRIFFSKNISESETETFAKILESDAGWDEGERNHEPIEEKPIVPEIDEYVVDENDGNLFYNKRYKDFSLRTAFGTVDGIKGKDTMVLTSSLPLQFNNGKFTFDVDKKELFATIPQIVKVIKNDKHGLALEKSPACKWDDIKDTLLRFFFKHLNHVYAWKFEKQVIWISTVPNPDILNFEMRLETRYHLDLGRKLCGIKGMGGHSSLYDGVPLCMDHPKHYDFTLGKARTYTWEELLPKIKKVFEEYFPAGVEFKNVPSQYSANDFSRRSSLREFDDMMIM